MLGAEGEMLDYALRYGRVLMLSLPTFILQNIIPWQDYCFQGYGFINFTTSSYNIS